MGTTNETKGIEGLTENGDRAVGTIGRYAALAAMVVWRLDGGGSSDARRAKETLEWALALSESVRLGEDVDALYQSDWLRFYGAADLLAAVRDLATCGGLAVGAEAIRDGIEAYNRKAGTGYYRGGVLVARP